MFGISPLRKIWLVSETEFPPPHPREREAAGALWTSDIYFLLSLYIGKHRRCNTVCILNSIASGFKLDLISFCLDFFLFPLASSGRFKWLQLSKQTRVSPMCCFLLLRCISKTSFPRMDTGMRLRQSGGQIPG